MYKYTLKDSSAGDKKKCVEPETSTITESSKDAVNIKGLEVKPWRKTGVELDYKKANKESRLQIAKDRKKDRAYIPPLNLFEDHSHDDSFYSDEENFEGLDYEDAHLGFDPEKSLKFHY
ncbi:hypothetical protein Tco_0125541 [Tanacetum coccineum]